MIMDVLKKFPAPRGDGPTGILSSLTSRTAMLLRLNKPARFLLLVVLVSAFIIIFVGSRFDVRQRDHASVQSPKDAGSSGVLSLQVRESLLLHNNSFASGVDGDAVAEVPVLLLRGQGSNPNSDLDSRALNVSVPLRVKTLRQLQAVVKEAEMTMFPWQLPRVRSVNCQKLFEGDPEELARARSLEHNNSSLIRLPDETLGSLASTCPQFLKTFSFITSPLSEEERDFPIAYSILVFQDAAQVLNLLRAIYRPQNYYCLHVDTKSSAMFRRAMAAMAYCFPNVFLSSRSVDVRWGTFTVLEPEIVCMEDLWRHKAWKYFINLTGQEFPLKTNHELVQILTAFQGANSLEGTRKRANKGRWMNVKTPPGGVIPTKGSVHIAVNRDFVDFILHTTIGQEFLNWSRNVIVPDEVFFSSLNHNPHLGIRGTYLGDPETDPTNYLFLARYKNWGGFPFEYPCASGKRVRLICILSSGDLPLLETRPELFANKFYPDDSRVALGCLMERIFNRTRNEFFGNVEFNASFYADMSFVKNRVKVSTFNTTL